MQDPRSTVRSLVEHGRHLERHFSDQRGSPVGRALFTDGGSLLVSELFGGSRLAKRAGRLATTGMLARVDQQCETQFEAWRANVEHSLAGVSVARGNLTTRGNSAHVVSGFRSAATASKVDTRLKRAIAYLDRLQTQSLVFNGDIPAFLKARIAEEAADKRRLRELRLLDLPAMAPGIDALRFPHRAALRDALHHFPDECAMVEGAMDAFLGDAQDRFRHAVTGARSGLEGIGRRVTGQNDWKAALRQRTHEEVARMFSATYSLLSSLTHPGRRPSQSTVELALKQAINLTVWLAQHMPPPPSPEPT